MTEGCGFVELFLKETDLPFLHIKREAHQRLKHCLRTMALHIAKKLKSSKLSMMKFFNDKFYNYVFHKEELVDVKLTEEKNEKLKEELEEAKKERDTWAARCSNLEKDMEKIYQEMLTEIEKLKEELHTERNNSDDLRRYLSALLAYEKNNNNDDLIQELKAMEEQLLVQKRAAAIQRQEQENRGRLFDDVGERQKQRKLEILRTRAQKALCFVESFGLKITGISLESRAGKAVHLLQQQSTGSKFSNLPAEEKENVEKVLFLLDRFCASDELYHEIVQVRK